MNNGRLSSRCCTSAWNILPTAMVWTVSVSVERYIFREKKQTKKPQKTWAKFVATVALVSLPLEHLWCSGGNDARTSATEQYRLEEFWYIIVGKVTPPSGIILCMCPTNERWRYSVMPSLIGWVHTQNDPCTLLPLLGWMIAYTL